MHFKYFKSIGRNVRYFVYHIKKLTLIHTKINVIRGIAIFNVLIKFEFNQKHCLDINVPLIFLDFIGCIV